MKLKLEAQNDITVLIASEDIALQHIPVLKAGITKLAQAGKLAIVLDLTGVDSIPPSLIPELSSLTQWAKGVCSYFNMVSPVSELSPLSNREEAVKSIQTSPEFAKTLDETIKNKLKALQTEKSKLEQMISKLGAGNDITALQKENSRLKKQIKHLEIQISHYLKARAEPFESAPLKQSLDSVISVLETILEQKNILNPNG